MRAGLLGLCSDRVNPAHRVVHGSLQGLDAIAVDLGRQQPYTWNHIIAIDEERAGAYWLGSVYTYPI